MFRATFQIQTSAALSILTKTFPTGINKVYKSKEKKKWKEKQTEVTTHATCALPVVLGSVFQNYNEMAHVQKCN